MVGFGKPTLFMRLPPLSVGQGIAGKSTTRPGVCWSVAFIQTDANFLPVVVRIVGNRKEALFLICRGQADAESSADALAALPGVKDRMHLQPNGGVRGEITWRA